MADIVVKLVGVETREYTNKDTGELKKYCGLHVVHMNAADEDGVKGYRVEQLTCPQGVDSRKLEVGSYYGLKYRMQNTRSGTFARLVGLVETDENGEELADGADLRVKSS